VKLKKKIGLVSLGCPKNLVDSEKMLASLKDNGYEIVADEKEAEIIIVNTCGFIESSKQESINTILEMAENKKQSCELLIVTGCLAQRYKETILEEIPEVDAVVGTGNYGEIASVIKAAYGGGRPLLCTTPGDGLYQEDGKRIISTGKSYAYLKIAEGCDNCCTYCVIPSLRGPYRSRRIEEIMDEAAFLAASGIKEIILVAQDTTRYGTDLYGERQLTKLIRKISELPGIEWIRLLYCYPEEIDDELINEIANNDKVCKYIDIPLQHASDSILKRMGRRGDSKYIASLLEKLRSRINDLVIRTTFISGFPGETEEDHSILVEFMKKYRFDRLGIFMYSKEEDTPAAKMAHQIPERTKKLRYSSLMELQKEISAELNKKRLGRVYKVLVEGVADDGIFYYGRSYGEAPDIDGLIYFTSTEPLEEGQMVNVEILNCEEYDLTGEVKNESAK